MFSLKILLLTLALTVLPDAALGTSPPGPVGCARAIVADIVFLVDGSTSIGTEDFHEVRVFLRNLITGLDIGPDEVRIGLAQYSDEPHIEFLLKDHMDKTSMLAAVANFPYRAGRTYTGKAIDFLVDQFFTEQAGSRARQRVPQIAVIITDGESNDQVTKPAQRLRQHGVIVFGIGVGQAHMVELEEIANRPSSRFRFKIDNYQALQRLTEGLLQTVCISADDQRNALAEKFADIVFLVDGAEFQQWRGILTELANQLNIGASAHRLSLAQYGQRVTLEFKLNTHQTKEETMRAIAGLQPIRRQPSDPRNLGSALRYTRNYLFTPGYGSREDQGYRQFLVVLSGKNSDDWDFHRESRLIRSSGITVVGMSLRDGVQDTRSIATAPYSFQYTSNAVSFLKAVIDTEEENIVTGDCKGAKIADIVFIIDDSGSIDTPEFQMVRNFLHSIVNGLDVSQSKVRVGIVMYNDNAEAQVYLNAFSHKNDLLNFIKILPHVGGGTKTGAALQFARENVFVKDHGSRKDQGIQQVAVVITDGKSQDQVDTPAANLRRAGVTVYSVGVKGANQTQLTQMASHPTDKHVFVVDSFSKLQSAQQSLQKTLCHNIIKEATVDPRKRNKDGCSQTDEADIFFLIDDSGSIEYKDFDDMQKFIIEFLTTFRVGPQHVRVGVAKYSDSPNLEIDVTDHSDSKTLEKAVKAIERKGGGTETGKALTFMGPLFTRAEQSRGHKVPQFLVVITDGKSTDKVKIPAETLRAQEITVYAIGVRGAIEAQLLEIAGDPDKKYSINNFDALKSIKDDIIRDICSKEACKDVPSDLIILIDSSGSIAEDDYTKMKSFMRSVISKSDIGENNIHVGVMQFGSSQRLEFPLNRHYSKEALLTAISDMQQVAGGTHTGGAISSVSQYFDAAYGGRPGIRQRLIVITDGESQDVVRGPAAALREKGVLIYAIGVDDANSNQLLEISGSPDRMYSERDVNSLKGLESKITNELCDPGRECKKIEQADIIFLVDFSKSITDTEFESMQKYIKSVVDQSAVGKDLTRFGVILYSTDIKSIFSLKDYDSKKEVIEAMKGMTIKRGDTHTGEALKYSLDYFNSQWGGRKSLNVPQILMVITDGEATNPWILEEQSRALRDNGIDVFSIGVKEANLEELKTIAGDKSRVFYVSDFDALETLYKMVGPALCKSTKKRCQKKKADLVFLLDQSTSIVPDDYKLMKDFTIDLVNTFSVSEDDTRIGLARFSTGFRDEFYLDRFHTNEAVNDYISNLMQKGGDTHLGDALKRIKEYFQASRGDRKSSGISQNLVIITDGEAQDSWLIEDAANHLRSIGIQIFVIGIGNIHDLELLQIAGTPKRLFTVLDFKSLENIKEQVIDTICEPDVYPLDCLACMDVPSDLIFLTDSSGSIHPDDYMKMKNFLISVIRKSDIGKNNIHVGVMQFGSSQQLEFPLSLIYSKEDMLKAISDMQQVAGSTHTGGAISSVSQYFDAAYGGRPGIRQRLIVITDGESQDVVQGPAAALREKGVLIYAIGVGDANSNQLLEISGSPDRIYSQTDFDTLVALDSKIANELCETECKKIEQADIIFLVDFSKSISRAEFGSMEKYMMSVVDQATVGKDLTRFGVILFSDEPTSVFSLKQYDNKIDIFRAISALQGRQGDTYTGKALQYSLEYFKSQWGGRKSDNVPQILMVITDGEATDRFSLEEPSKALRDNGIDVFSIGVKGANQAELETIAGQEKSRVFFVSDFNALETLYKMVGPALCKSTKKRCSYRGY